MRVAWEAQPNGSMLFRHGSQDLSRLSGIRASVLNIRASGCLFIGWSVIDRSSIERMRVSWEAQPNRFMLLKHGSQDLSRLSGIRASVLNIRTSRDGGSIHFDFVPFGQ